MRWEASVVKGILVQVVKAGFTVVWQRFYKWSISLFGEALL